MKRWFIATIASTVLTVSAQVPGAFWAGEWGAFEPVPKAGQVRAHTEGYGLSITDCAERSCSFAFLVASKTGHGDAKRELQVDSDTQAVARLLASTRAEEKCTLALEKTGEPQLSIAVKERTGDCTYFLTPGASFVHIYPLRSKTPFYGEIFIPDCFVGTSVRRRRCARVRHWRNRSTTGVPC